MQPPDKMRFPSTFPLLALALASSTSAIFPSSPLNDEGSSVLLPTEPQVIIDENVYVVPHKSLAESFGLRESEGRDAAEKVRKDQTVEEHMLAEKIVPLWIGERKESLRDSPLAAVHIAAGSFETARTLLQDQLAIANFTPLEPLFLSLHESSQLFLQADSSQSPLALDRPPNRVTVDTIDSIPTLAGYDLQSIVLGDLAEAYVAVTKGKWEPARELFRKVLRECLFVAASSEEEAEEVEKIVASCREYILGLSLEIQRRRIFLQPEWPNNIPRTLELAAYFTHCDLQPHHLQLALRNAMSHWSEAENYRTAAIFAHRILALDPIAAKITPQIETHARAAILQADVSPQDALPTAYDPFTPFQLCASTLTPIYAGSGEAVVKGRYSGASYKEEFKGEVCRVDEISLIGGRGCGLRSRI